MAVGGWKYGLTLTNVLDEIEAPKKKGLPLFRVQHWLTTYDMRNLAMDDPTDFQSCPFKNLTVFRNRLKECFSRDIPLSKCQQMTQGMALFFLLGGYSRFAAMTPKKSSGLFSGNRNAAGMAAGFARDLVRWKAVPGDRGTWAIMDTEAGSAPDDAVTLTGYISLLTEEFIKKYCDTKAQEGLRKLLHDFAVGCPSAEQAVPDDTVPIEPGFVTMLAEYLDLTARMAEASQGRGVQPKYLAEGLTWLLTASLLRGKFPADPAEFYDAVDSAHKAADGMGIIGPDSGSKKTFTDKSLIRPLTGNRSNRSQGGTYVRRDVLLDQIKDLFDKGDDKNIVFLSGMGGAGKSELARAYASESTDRYRDIFMFTYRGDISGGLLDQINASNVRRKVESEDLKGLERDTLIIADNCNENDESLLNELEYGTGKADILVTTRLGTVGTYENIIPVDENGQEQFAYDVFEKNYCRKVRFGEKKTIKENESADIKNICGYLQYNAMFSALVAIRLRDHEDLSIKECARRINYGISSISGELLQEKANVSNEQIITYSKDMKEKDESLLNILRSLFSDILKRKFDKNEMEVLRLLCLSPARVHDSSFLFQLLEGCRMTGAHKAAAWRLLDDGLLQGDDDQLSIHPLIAEFFITEYKEDGLDFFAPNPGYYVRMIENYVGMPEKMLAHRAPDPWIITNRILEIAPNNSDTRNLKLAASMLLDINSHFYYLTNKVLVSFNLSRHAAIYGFGIKKGKKLFVCRDFLMPDKNKRDHILYECDTDDPDQDLIPAHVTVPGFEFTLDLSDTIMGISLSRIAEGWCSGNGFVKEALLPNTILSIGPRSFKGCSGLKNIIIPKGVTGIEPETFYDCYNLNSITIPKSVTNIGEKAFYNCRSLRNIIFPDGITSIEPETFYGCYNLNSVIIPKGVTNIGVNAFGSCESLKSIVIPEGVTRIEPETFRLCSSLKSVTIPKSITGIASSAFLDCKSLKEIHISSLEAWLHLPYGAYNSLSGNLYLNDEPITSITIPNGITMIREYAFEHFHNLRSVTIPVSVKTIEYCAFRCCYNLTNVKIANTVSGIAPNAFESCRSLTDIKLPDNLKRIRPSVFRDCINLTSIIIPDGVTSIGEWAFLGCCRLESITIPDSVSSIGEWTFDRCEGIEEIHITSLNAWLYIDIPLKHRTESGLKGNLYLKGELLTSVDIPGGVARIRVDAFRGCSHLTNVTIPNSVTSIGAHAFRDCSSLANVIIPESVTSIGDSAFHGCSSLVSIKIPEGVTSIGASAFENCHNLKSITIPKSMTSVGRRAFSDCTSINSITIPEGVDICPDAFEGMTGMSSKFLCVGEAVLKYFGNEEDVILPEQITRIKRGAFSNCNIKSIIISDGVTTIEPQAFWGCSRLTSVTIPNSVASIGDKAFYGCSELKEIYISDLTAWLNINKSDEDQPYTCLSGNLYLNDELLTNIIIPNSITDIRAGAFRKCSGLISVTVPPSVTNIGDNAFLGCSSLTSVMIPNSVIRIGGSAFAYCSNLTNISIPNSVTSIEDEAFFKCGSLKNITIPDSVTNIGRSAFAYCDRLSDISIPNSVNIINLGAFSRCSSLTSIIIPNSINDIYGDAFKNCINLTNVHIPSSVKGIWTGAFSNCQKLDRVEIESGLTHIGFCAFEKCESLKSITIPDSVVNIEKSAFENCVNLTNVKIPNYIENIESRVFYNCRSLTSIIIPDGVISIGPEAFLGCNNLTSVTLPDSVESIGQSAFTGCIKPREIHIKNLETWLNINSYRSGLVGGLYINNELITDIVIPDGISEVREYAFYNFVSLTSVTIPKNITHIGNGAFYNCSGLTHVIIENGPSSIGDMAFYNCGNLTNIVIPESVMHIGICAFTRCNINKITFMNPFTNLGNCFSDFDLSDLSLLPPECDTIICGYKNSTAEQYAKDNGLEFEEIQ